MELTTLSHVVLWPNSLQSGYILSIVVQLALHIHQMDVDTAFLYVPIDEPNWVKVPDDTNLLPGDSGVYILLLLFF